MPDQRHQHPSPQHRDDAALDLDARLDALGQTLPAPPPGGRYLAHVRHARVRRRQRLAAIALGAFLALTLVAGVLLRTATPPPAPAQDTLATAPQPENPAPIRAFAWRLRGGDWLLPEVPSSTIAPRLRGLPPTASDEPEPLRARDVHQMLEKIQPQTP